MTTLADLATLADLDRDVIAAFDDLPDPDPDDECMARCLEALRSQYTRLSLSIHRLRRQAAKEANHV